MTVTFLVKIILKKFTFKYVVTSFLEILESHFTLFVYVDALCPSQQFFSHVWTFSGLNHQRIKCLAHGLNTMPPFTLVNSSPSAIY